MNELGREYKENRRRAERENRWDGKAQKYGMLSSRGGGGELSVYSRALFAYEFDDVLYVYVQHFSKMVSSFSMLLLEP